MNFSWNLLFNIWSHLRYSSQLWDENKSDSQALKNIATV